MCYRCFKPAVACVCADIKRVDNHTGVIILQHPRERHHPLGTARFARLGLNRVQVQVCGPKDPESMARASRLPPNTAFLYPSPDARDVRTIPPDERPDNIVLVDATWGQSRTVVSHAPWLRALPCIRLDPVTPSEYRLRREPKADYLSTIEATIATLRALEPETVGLDELMGAFRLMIDRQIDRSGRVPQRRIKVPKARRSLQASLPRALTTRYDKLVVCYGEVAKETRDGERLGDIVYWCAVRPATGETFARFVRPTRVTPNPLHIEHMGLTFAQIEGGLAPEQFRQQWREFLGRDSIVAAWNRHSLSAVMPPGESLLLKGIACNLTGKNCGHLDYFVAQQGLETVPTPFEGRAGRQLGDTLAVTRHIRELGIEKTP